MEGGLSGNQDSLNVGIVDQLLRGTVRPARICQPLSTEERREESTDLTVEGKLALAHSRASGYGSETATSSALGANSAICKAFTWSAIAQGLQDEIYRTFLACRLPIRPTPITPIRAFLLDDGISTVIARDW